MGRAVVDLCSGIWAVSTLVCQLRDHLDGPSRTVFGRAVPFASYRGSALIQNLQAEEADSEWIQTQIALATWCCSSECNQVGTKLAAMQFFHGIDEGVELPTSSLLTKRALRGMAKSHVAAGYPA